jgi:hypothetical protein
MKTKTTYELSVYNLSRLIIGGGMIGGSLTIIILGKKFGNPLLVPCLNIILGFYIAFIGIKSAKKHTYQKNAAPRNDGL